MTNTAPSASPHATFISLLWALVMMSERNDNSKPVLSPAGSEVKKGWKTCLPPSKTLPIEFNPSRNPNPTIEN